MMTYLFPEKTIQGLEDWRATRSIYFRFSIFIIATFLFIYILASSQNWFKFASDSQGIILIAVVPFFIMIILGIICYLWIVKAEEYARLSIVYKGEESIKNTKIAIENALKNSDINAKTSHIDDYSETYMYDCSCETKDDNWKIELCLEHAYKGTLSFYLRIGPINEKNEKKIIGFMKDLTRTLKESKLK